MSGKVVWTGSKSSRAGGAGGGLGESRTHRAPDALILER